MFILGKVVENVPLSSERQNNSENSIIRNPILPENAEQGEEDLSTDDLKGANNFDIGPTILFCNPNAGIYEFMYFEVILPTFWAPSNQLSS